MTTNVCDLVSGVLTSDTRWSRESGGWLIFVDDTGYDKIAYDKKLAFLFAGDLESIDSWKNWVFSGRPGQMPIAKLTGMSAIVVDTKLSKLVFQSHTSLPSSVFGSAVRALFAGTGAIFAKNCWDKNKCAKTAVKTAVDADIQSGGLVVYFKCNNRENNILTKVTQSEVKELAKTKGYIVNMNNTQAPITVQEAANDPSNPAAQAIANMVLSGGVSFSAPFPEMDKPWSEEKIKEFSGVMAEYD